jgi:hypothetical protein
MSTSQTTTIDKVKPLPAQAMHPIVCALLAVFGAISITYPIAMFRVSNMEKFRGFHVKSLTPEYQSTQSTAIPTSSTLKK